MLKFGSVTVDIKNNKVYGDVEHCTVEDLTESAIELLRIAPKGATAISKDYFGGYYLYGPRRLSNSLLWTPEVDQRLLDYLGHEPEAHFMDESLNEKCLGTLFAEID